MFDTLIEKLQNDSYLTLETTPPHEPSLEHMILSIKKANIVDKIDGFTSTDSPLAKLKYNSILASYKIQEEFKKPCIATMTMRDKNKIALQSDLLGANDFNVRAILALTGDPASMSNQPRTKGVFESNSSLLLQIIKSFNYGLDIAGHPFKIPPKEIYPFAVSNSFSKRFSSLQRKMHKKISEGAKGIITQPVFDKENAKQLLQTFKDAKKDVAQHKQDTQLIFGIFPITKLRTALFLSAQVPGIYVPQIWIDKLEVANKISEIEEYKVGMELSKKILLEVNKINPKVHVMSANRFEIVKELIS